MADKQVRLSSRYDKNVAFLINELRVEESFDMMHHKMEYAQRKFGLFFVDGFAKDEAMVQIMRNLTLLKKEDLAQNAIEKLVRTFIPYIEVETTDDLEEMVSQILAGQAVMLVEHCDIAILLDVREYPVRSPDEPDIEKVVRGPRDGFVETIVFNCVLIRRRIRDRSLVMKSVQIGKRSKTDIVISYVGDVVDLELVKRIEHMLQDISIDGLAMAEKTVEEFIFGENLNPYPLVRYTERADTCANHLLEGHVLIIVDGSPSVMICPSTFWHHLQHAEEYRQKPVIGAFLRWIRFIAVFASLFLMPLWYVFALQPELLPTQWQFIGVDEVGHLSLFWQFFLAEIGVEMLRMAAIHTPSALATALGLVAAILIGEIAIEVGLFTYEVILYLAVAVVGTFATPSYELSLANRLIRVFFLVAAATLGVEGLVVASLLWLILLVNTKTLNLPYMWPFIPFDIRGFIDVLVRTPVPLQKHRSKVLNIKDDQRQSNR